MPSVQMTEFISMTGCEQAEAQYILDVHGCEPQRIININLNKVKLSFSILERECIYVHST